MLYTERILNLHVDFLKIYNENNGYIEKDVANSVELSMKHDLPISTVILERCKFKDVIYESKAR